MLANDDVLEAIDLRVDYLGGAASIEEHGVILQSVNKYELCAEATLPQTEWWPFVHCMYGLQACLSYEADASVMSCAEAESGADDDLAIAGTDSIGDDCVCTLEGVVDYCATMHTSTTFDELAACKTSERADELYKQSDDRAEVVNGGDPLWVKINGVEYSYSSNETVPGLAAWATSVFSVTCQALAANEIASPDSCAMFLYRETA
mmetsp:Transcript_5176/g.15732  ORF Transcript_5176/g.15732 Transcript_5176/m.15732 type:complete len:206 (-) Transcript_5176:290-907(-)